MVTDHTDPSYKIKIQHETTRLAFHFNLASVAMDVRAMARSYIELIQRTGEVADKLVEKLSKFVIRTIKDEATVFRPATKCAACANNEHSLALAHHAMHMRKFADFSRGWGIGEETFEFWSWLARQYVNVVMN